ncbi:MAG: dipeptidase [Melioribacteraceae bacterium]|nr:dipeptidase [Melioribacteraceae bacterium]
MKYFFSTLLLSLLLLSCETAQKTDAEIHSEILTIDTHTDIPIKLTRDSTYKLSERHTFQDSRTRVDLPRMQDGGLDAAIFAIWTAQGERNELGNKKAKERALEIIAAVNKNLEEAEDATFAKTTEDLVNITDSKKHAILMGLENGYPIGNNILEVENFYNLGIRYITLCHVKDNDICDSSTDESEDEGLSSFGINVLNEMNRLGIIVDVSHISDSAFYQVVKLSKTPVIASHSNARALCNHPRNMTDGMIEVLANNGGVIHVNFYSGYLKLTENNTALTNKQISKYKKKWAHLLETENGRKEYERALSVIKNKPPVPPEVTIDDIINHIDYIVKLVGINHVGIGSDFDGGGGVSGLEDVSQLGNITSQLLKLGYSQKDIEKLWSGNFIRVFREVEKFAKNIEEKSKS